MQENMERTHKASLSLVNCDIKLKEKKFTIHDLSLK